MGYRLLFKHELHESWSQLATIRKSILETILVRFYLTRRLFRKGVYKLLKTSDGFFIFADRSIYYFEHSTKALSLIGSVSGSRPLYPCVHNDNLYYGEYGDNADRQPVNVHRYDARDKKWSISSEFHGVRHIHGIFSDPFTNEIWITTGDLDTECKILHSKDEMQSWDVFVSGLQKFRAIYLHFDETSITYGTDAPHEQNFIYEVARENAEEISRTSVGSPVFFGAVTNGDKLLTTAIEPSRVNSQRFSELWFKYSDNKWVNLVKLRKDRLPKKLFQYGQILLPSGPGRKGIIAFTPIASEYDEKVVTLNFN